MGAAVLSVGMLAACAAQAPPSVEAAGEDPPRGETEPQASPAAELLDIVREIRADHGGRVGIAVYTADGVVSAGEPGRSPAWSTIKVPVAIAADKQDLVVDGVIEQAISASDNDAAYQLRVLADEVHMPGVPELADPMGRTEWSVAQQAEFATSLPCIDTSGTTYDAMADIVEWQDYGLGDLPGARFKGGWGPDTDTVYTLRQFGTVPTDDGLLGVALIVHPDDNTHDTAEAMVVDLVAALAERISAAVFPAPPACSPS